MHRKLSMKKYHCNCSRTWHFRQIKGTQFYTDCLPQSAISMSWQDSSVFSILVGTLHSFQRLHKLHQQMILHIPTSSALRNSITSHVKLTDNWNIVKYVCWYTLQHNKKRNFWKCTTPEKTMYILTELIFTAPSIQ